MNGSHFRPFHGHAKPAGRLNGWVLRGSCTSQMSYGSHVTIGAGTPVQLWVQ